MAAPVKPHDPPLPLLPRTGRRSEGNVSGLQNVDTERRDGAEAELDRIERVAIETEQAGAAEADGVMEERC